MELLITKSELPVFNCFKYAALMEHIDDRHISRETSSQISLARSKFSAMYMQEADLKISYFRTKIVPDNEPLDEIEPFIYLSNHVIRYIHENSIIVFFFFIAYVNGAHCGCSSGRSGSFCSLRSKLSLMMGLILIIMHLKWLSMNARNSTFSGLFASIQWNSISVRWVTQIRLVLQHLAKKVSEDGTVMLKLAIKPTFENTTPEDVR